MALILDITTREGVTVAGAYARIEGVALPGKAELSFGLRCYVLVAGEDGQVPHVIPFHEETHFCAYDMDGDNPMAQGYLHLKSLPEFAAAVDA